MSNVGHHESAEVFSLPLSLRSHPYLEPVAATAPESVAFAAPSPLASTTGNEEPLQCKQQGIWQGKAAFSHATANQTRVPSGRKRRQCPEGQESQSMVGASRRLESQVVGAAEYGSLGPALLPSTVAVGSKRSRLYRLAPTGAAQSVMPNPSIERTCPGKPGHASHVKR